MTRRLVLAAMAAAAFAAWSQAPAFAGWSPEAASAAGVDLLGADDSSSLAQVGAASEQVSETRIPVRVRGDLAVDFHGDRTTGCAARGLCGFSGTVIWQPPPTATLETDAFRMRGRTEYDAFLGFVGGNSDGASIDGGVTTADVRFTPDGSAGSSSICTDAAATGANVEMRVHLRAASLTLAAATPSLLQTRCAGPLQSDIARLLVRRIVDVATLANGHAGVSLASSSDFAAHGLAGTVTSTVLLTLGRAHTERFGTGTSTPNGPSFRTVLTTYRAHLDGSVLTRIQGDPSSCGLLGSCGANGTFALRVHSKPGTLEIAAITRKRRPLRDALTALGLRKGGNSRGVSVIGFFVARGPATYAVAVTHDATTCSDIGPGGLGVVHLTAESGRLSAQFGVVQGAPHLRCPGPTTQEGNAFVSGTERITHLARHGGTIHLRTGVKFEDDGYTGHTTSDLTLTVSRPKLTISNDALRSPGPG